LLKGDIKYRFGEKLRLVREKRGMTLKSVALKAQVSESLVSQIERNRVSPSIDTLFTIADVLEIDLDYLFRDFKQNKKVDLVREEERESIVTPQVTYRQLSVIEDHFEEYSIEAFLMEINPQGEKGSTDYGHVGREFGYIMEGKGELLYGTETYPLKKGDSIAFSSDIPHIFRNTGKGVLKAIWVITPPRMIFSENK